MWHPLWPPTLARVSPSPAFHMKGNPRSWFQSFRSFNIFLPGKGAGINSLDGERSSRAGREISQLSAGASQALHPDPWWLQALNRKTLKFPTCLFLGATTPRPHPGTRWHATGMENSSSSEGLEARRANREDVPRANSAGQGGNVPWSLWQMRRRAALPQDGCSLRN